MQKVTAQSATALLDSANSCFDEKNYAEAIFLYEIIYEKESDNSFVAFRLAESYRFVRDYVNAQYYYEEVLEESFLEFPQAQLWYAMCLKFSENYDAARVAFEKIAFDTANAFDSLIVRRAHREIDACIFADSLKQHPLPIIIENAGAHINTQYSDFAAIPFDSTSIIFTSSRREQDDAPREIRIFAELFYSQKNDSGWRNAKKISELNTSGFMNGNGAFSPDRKIFFFTRCTQIAINTLECKLYVSEFISEKWSEPLLLNSDINLPGYISTQPAVAKGKRGELILYFVSNRPGGKGGNDIWFVNIFSDGKISRAENCGSVINTVENEASPFYHQRNQTLYFSSEGHRGCGGYDIFQSDGSLAQWSEVKNAGYPLNSGVDDIFFNAQTFLNDGFLTSNRAGGITEDNQTETCCDDIYEYHWLIPQKIKPIIIITGRVKDVFSEENLSDAAITLRDIANSEWIEKEFTQKNTHSIFAVPSERTYKIFVLKEEYIPYAKKIDTHGLNDNDTIYFEIALEKLPVHVGQILHTIHFEFGRTDIPAKLKPSLDSTAQFLVQQPQIIVEIGAHTDSKGSELFNAGLSKTRAMNIINYFIRLGINRKQLVFRAYSESMPIAPNENPDGSDNPEGRKLNRRTEVRVLEVIMIEE